MFNANARNNGGRLCCIEDALQITASIIQQHGHDLVSVVIQMVCIVVPDCASDSWYVKGMNSQSNICVGLDIKKPL